MYKIVAIAGLVIFSIYSCCAVAVHIDLTSGFVSVEMGNVQNVRLHYYNAGGGSRALVFVHGWAGHAGVWQFQVPACRQVPRCIFVDLPGHGKSDKPRIDYSFHIFVRSVKAILDDLGVDKVILVGHSNGALVGRQFYRLYPEMVQGMVITDGGLRPRLSHAQISNIAATLAVDNRWEYAEKLIDPMIAASTPEKQAIIKSMILKTPPYVMASSFLAMSDPALWRDDQILVPTLAVMSDSPVWGADYEAFLRSIAPRLEWRVMRSVSHFLMLDKPDEFNNLLIGFAKSIAAPGSNPRRPCPVRLAGVFET